MKNCSIRVLNKTLLRNAATISLFVAPAVGQECDSFEAAEHLASSGAYQDHFGRSVAIANTIAVVGAPDDNEFGDNAGAVYVYHFNGFGWVEHATLSAQDAEPRDFFGNSVSVWGDVILVGAPGNDDNGGASGSAYVFRFDGEDWVQEAKLLPADGSNTDYFGASVSVSGSTAILGATRNDDNGSNSGSAYIFEYNGSEWVEQAKLLASDGAEFDAFGVSVAISGSTAVVGAAENDDNGNSSGSIYIYQFDGEQWVEDSKLLPLDGNGSDFFGESVSISGNTVLVGAYWDDDNGSNSGSAYVFHNDGKQWAQQAKLHASDGADGNQLGYSVAISGNTAVVGANHANATAIESGSAYMFKYIDSQWVEVAQLLPSHGSDMDHFAASVALSDKRALVGAINHDDNGGDSGSAFIFELVCDCSADITGDGDLNFFDISGFLVLLQIEDPAADFNNDGSFNFFDISAFLSEFASGCP